MIRPLRRAHRTIWWLLLITLPTLLAAAVIVRPVDALPTGPACERSSQATVTIVDSRGSRSVLLPPAVTDAPDVLIYATPDRNIDTPGTQTSLIGRFHRGMTITPPAGTTSLLFYSAATHETVYRMEVQP